MFFLKYFWKNNKILILKNMDAKTLVLKIMKKERTPLNAWKIVGLTNLDLKGGDKAMTDLKENGLIFSPKRYYRQAK